MKAEIHVLAMREVDAHFLLTAGSEPTLHSGFDGLPPVQAARCARLPALEDKLVALGAQPLSRIRLSRQHLAGRAILARSADPANLRLINLLAMTPSMSRAGCCTPVFLRAGV